MEKLEDHQSFTNSELKILANGEGSSTYSDLLNSKIVEARLLAELILEMRALRKVFDNAQIQIGEQT